MNVRAKQSGINIFIKSVPERYQDVLQQLLNNVCKIHVHSSLHVHCASCYKLISELFVLGSVPSSDVKFCYSLNWWFPLMNVSSKNVKPVFSGVEIWTASHGRVTVVYC